MFTEADAAKLFGAEGFVAKQLADLASGYIGTAVIEKIDIKYQVQLPRTAGPVLLMP